jgi:glycosyltransferase involved in cell wall biosynthesis
MINIIAPINQLGYGIAGYNICKALDKYMPVSLWPIGDPAVTSDVQANYVKGLMGNRNMFNPKAPCIRIWHQHDMSQFVGGGKRVGFPIFELDSFNELEKHHLRSVDMIFVCSEWAKQIVINNLEKNYWGYNMEDITHVIPLGVDMKVFDGSFIQALSEPRPSSTVFFNCGKWEVRKGHDVLIDAFKKAFPHNEDVQLWMMCENPFNSPDENNYWHNKYNDPRVKLIPRVNSQEEVYNIMRKVDCGVFPARAEGWNLEALEMMACGKQVIITDFSAHTEFCTEENSMLVTIDDTEIAYDGKWFHGKGEWARIGEDQIEQISNHMRSVHVRVQNHENTYNKAGFDTATEFSWDNSAIKIMKVLDV